jgi:hypothetical protein
VRDKKKTRMVFMTSQALICQKVEAEVLFKEPEPASG